MLHPALRWYFRLGARAPARCALFAPSIQHTNSEVYCNCCSICNKILILGSRQWAPPPRAFAIDFVGRAFLPPPPARARFMNTVAYHQLAEGSCNVPITSLWECSASAAFLALTDTTASNDGHRRRQRRQVDEDGTAAGTEAPGSGTEGSGSGVVVAGMGSQNACDANVRDEYWCASR